MSSFRAIWWSFSKKKTYTRAVDEQQDMLDTDAFMNENEKRTKRGAHQISVCGK